MEQNSIWNVGSIYGDEYFTLQRTAEQICENLVDFKLCAWLPFNDKNSVWGGALNEQVISM